MRRPPLCISVNMKLCTLTNLKLRTGHDATDVADDDLLNLIIEGVSERFQKHCNREFERSEEAYEEFGGDETEIRVSRYPIELVVGFESKTGERVGFLPLSVNDDSYVIRHNCVISLHSPLAGHRTQCRVQYIGGYVLPGSTAGVGQTALPDDLEMACMEQCVHWWQNRDRLGQVSTSADGVTVQQFAQLDLLPSVKSTLEKYKRLNW